MVFFLIPILFLGSAIYNYEPEPDCDDSVSCEVDGVNEPTVNKFTFKLPSAPASYTKGN